MNQNTKYLIAITAGFMLALLLLKGCNQNNGQNRGVITKIDTIYQIQEKTTHFNDTILKLKYKDRLVPYQIIQNEIEDKIDTKANDYNFKYDTIASNKYGESKISITGWGYVSKVDVENTYQDTITTITKEITKYTPSKGLYLSPEYITHFNKEINQPTYKLNLDYVSNKWILGTGIGIQNNQPTYSFRIGYKIN